MQVTRYASTDLNPRKRIGFQSAIAPEARESLNSKSIGKHLINIAMLRAKRLSLPEKVVLATATAVVAATGLGSLLDIWSL